MPAREERAFFDSNTLLYAVGTDEAKATRAEELIRSRGTISVQVLNEVANVARRKMRMTWPETLELVAGFRIWFEVLPLTTSIHDTGLRLAARYGLSVYDGLIAAAALQGQCTVLYSEDMHDGLLIDGTLRVKNPFIS